MIYVGKDKVKDLWKGGEKIAKVWKGNELIYSSDFIPGLTYLQDFANLTAGQIKQVTDWMKEETPYRAIDKRDNKPYIIAKLKDGKVWMCDNLHYKGKCTSQDSDIIDEEYQITSGTFAPSNPKNGLFIDGNTANSNHTGDYYYSYAAATAGSGLTTSLGQAPYSISPKGWRLPTKDDVTSAQVTDWTKKPVPAVALTGAIRADFDSFRFHPANVGDYGYFWCSTTEGSGFDNATIRKNASGSNSAGSASVAPRDLSFGSPVRCILKAGIDRMTYMQDFADIPLEDYNAILASMDEEKAYTLKDKRDNNTYKIAKLKDGRIWMCENLKLESYNCTTADSDVASNYSCPTSSLTERDFNPSNGGWCKVGEEHYYSLPVCSAGTVTSGSISNDKTAIEHSILPKGWTLPNAMLGTDGDIYKLLRAYSPTASSVPTIPKTTFEELTKQEVPGFVLTGEFDMTVNDGTNKDGSLRCNCVQTPSENGPCDSTIWTSKLSTTGGQHFGVYYFSLHHEGETYEGGMHHVITGDQIIPKVACPIRGIVKVPSKEVK